MRTGLLLAALLVTTGCGTGGTPAPPPPGAFASVLAQIGLDGSVSLRTAQEAFSLSVAPLPGVQVSARARDDVPLAAGGPVRWLVGHWSELTTAQRQVASRAGVTPPMLTPVGQSGVTGGRRSALLLAARSSASPPPGALDSLIQQAKAYLSGRLGPLHVPTPVVVGTGGPGDGPAFAHPNAGDCPITVQPRLFDMAASDPDVVRVALTHELFHCYEAQLMGSLSRYWSLDSSGKAVNGFGSWLLEGAADWVAEEASLAAVGRTDANIQRWWKLYLEHPDVPLLQRSYDAIGFFVHAAETGSDPWTHFSSMFAAPDDRGAFLAAGGSEQDFLDTWASGYARQPSWGGGWDTTGAGITADRYSPVTDKFGPGQPNRDEWPIAPYANLDVQVDLGSDETTFSFLLPQIHGRLHMTDGGNFIAADIDSKTFCTRKGGDCSVPGCTAAPPPPFPGGMGYLAVTGGTAGGVVTVTGTQLDPHTCQQKPTPAPPPAQTGGGTRSGSCLVGRWVSGSVTGTDIPTGGEGVVLTITDVGGGSFDYTADYAAMQPVTNPTGHVVYKSSGVEKGTLTPSGNVLNRTIDDSGVTVTVQIEGLGTRVYPGTSGRHPGPAAAYTCTGTTLHVTTTHGEGDVVDNYTRQ
jgi:hypothetical protein